MIILLRWQVLQALRVVGHGRLLMRALPAHRTCSVPTLPLSYPQHYSHFHQHRRLISNSSFTLAQHHRSPQIGTYQVFALDEDEPDEQVELHTTRVGGSSRRSMSKDHLCPITTQETCDSHAQRHRVACTNAMELPFTGAKCNAEQSRHRRWPACAPLNRRSKKTSPACLLRLPLQAYSRHSALASGPEYLAAM